MRGRWWLTALGSMLVLPLAGCGAANTEEGLRKAEGDAQATLKAMSIPIDAYTRHETRGIHSCGSESSHTNSTGVDYSAATYDLSPGEAQRAIDGAEAYWTTRSDKARRSGAYLRVHLEDGGLFDPAYEVSVSLDEFSGKLRVFAGYLCK